MDDKSQRSPIFILFLDCVSQLLKQHPTRFEFNVKFICEIAEQSSDGRFGNFICNSEKVLQIIMFISSLIFGKEFVNYEISKKTKSLWSYMNLDLFEYTNYNYKEDSKKSKVIIPDSKMRNMKLWEEYFFRFLKKSHMIKSIKELINFHFFCFC